MVYLLLSILESFLPFWSLPSSSSSCISCTLSSICSHGNLVKLAMFSQGLLEYENHEVLKKNDPIVEFQVLKDRNPPQCQPCKLLSFETNFQNPLTLIHSHSIRRQVFKVKYTIQRKSSCHSFKTSFLDFPELDSTI